MKRNSLLFSIIGIIIAIAIIIAAVVLTDVLDDDDQGGVIVSIECDNLRQRCIDFCSPNDPMCVEDCNNEAEACRANQSTQALENKIEELKKERERQAHNLAVAQCRDRCYENAFSQPGQPAAELTPETFIDPEFQELLRNARLCASECGSYR